MWNTLAHLADFGMLVTRTDPEAPKHKGMTYFALDMHSPGVEVRPLRQITGEAEFNEVYLTDVRVPDAPPDRRRRRGWRVSLTTLMNERNAIGEWYRRRRDASAGRRGQRRRRSSGNRSAEADRRAVDKDRLMQLWVQAEVGRLTNMRAAQNARAGNPGPEMSIAKLAYSELNKALYDFAMDLLGADALVGFDYTFRRPDDLDVQGTTRGLRYAFLRVRANSIEGGTSEIMRNILGEQVLGLPGEPRVDKDLPGSRSPAADRRGPALRRSGEAEAAVDREGGSGDVGVAHQEEDAVGDLLGPGDATEWGALRLRRDHRLEAITGHAGEHRRVDDAGSDDVHADRRQLEGDDPSEDLRAAGGRRDDGAAAAGSSDADARADGDGAVGHLRRRRTGRRRGRPRGGCRRVP